MGHDFQDIGPENIANYFEVKVSQGTTLDGLKKLIKKFGDDIELRFVLTQNYQIVIGNELHEDLINNNVGMGDKVLRGVVKTHKPKQVKYLEVSSEIAQFFKAKNESPQEYGKALDIISNKLLTFIDKLKTEK